MQDKLQRQISSEAKQVQGPTGGPLLPSTKDKLARLRSLVIEVPGIEPTEPPEPDGEAIDAPELELHPAYRRNMFD